MDVDVSPASEVEFEGLVESEMHSEISERNACVYGHSLAECIKFMCFSIGKTQNSIGNLAGKKSPVGV